jgi:acetyl-CoA acetyltransferase
MQMNGRVAIVGIGQNEFGRFLPVSQIGLGAKALRSVLADAGLERKDIDGVALHMGWPLGADYERTTTGSRDVYGLEVDYVHQSWTHGRFATSALQHAAMAVACGMADLVACITAVSFTREMSTGSHHGRFRPDDTQPSRAPAGSPWRMAAG